MIKDYITKDTRMMEIEDNFNIRNIYSNCCVYDDELAMQLFIETGINMASSIHLIDNWYKIGEEWYFFKNDREHLFRGASINELLGEVITNYFELDAAHYEIARLVDNGDTFGLVTRNFCEKNVCYGDLIDYFPRNNRTGISIFKCLTELSNKDERFKGLLIDIKRLFIRDFLVGEKDRKNCNLLFKEQNGQILLGPVYDNEDSFLIDDYEAYIYRNFLGELDITKKATRELLVGDYYFQYLLDRLMSFNMNKAINITEEVSGIIIPNENKDNYIRHNRNIKRLVKENNLIRKL